jgi:hypothetical protein
MRSILARTSPRRAAATSLAKAVGNMRLRSSGTAEGDTSLEQKAVSVKVEVERPASPLRPTRRRGVADNEATSAKREKVERDDNSHPPSKKKARKVGVKKERVPRKEPDNWKELLRGIEEMRVKKDAEVDKYGCEVRSLHSNRTESGDIKVTKRRVAVWLQVFFDESFPPHVCRFHVLIAAMMSSQTKDPVSAAAMGRLIKHGGGAKQVSALVGEG